MKDELIINLMNVLSDFVINNNLSILMRKNELPLGGNLQNKDRSLAQSVVHLSQRLQHCSSKLLSYA